MSRELICISTTCGGDCSKSNKYAPFHKFVVNLPIEKPQLFFTLKSGFSDEEQAPPSPIFDVLVWGSAFWWDERKEFVWPPTTCIFFVHVDVRFRLFLLQFSEEKHYRLWSGWSASSCLIFYLSLDCNQSVRQAEMLNHDTSLGTFAIFIATVAAAFKTPSHWHHSMSFYVLSCLLGCPRAHNWAMQN